MSESSSALVVVLERNRRVGQRIARVAAAAAGLGDVAHVERPDNVGHLIGPKTRLIACGESDVEQISEEICPDFPQLRLATWTADDPARVIGLAQKVPGLSNILGWPSFQSMPRPWEIGLCVRRICVPHEPMPGLVHLLRWGSTEHAFTPSTTIDRDVVVSEVARLVLKLGATARARDRLAEIAHEMLMNAMYDAPVDEHGQPRYAHDRNWDLVLGKNERPTFRFVTDGMLLGLDVIDRFGGLTREHVIDGVNRGLTALDSDEMDKIVDTSHGGAGLGMARLYRASAGLICDVIAGRATRVISFHELDISPREMRGLPGSLHYFASPAGQS
ncbi:MAG: hypothetical protein MJE77_27530 [Proteobacteria bacterium]|nr:hypothetical protein [Pseudomonadota bacterium]